MIDPYHGRSYPWKSPAWAEFVPQTETFFNVSQLDLQVMRSTISNSELSKLYQETMVIILYCQGSSTRLSKP